MNFSYSILAFFKGANNAFFLNEKILIRSTFVAEENSIQKLGEARTMQTQSTNRARQRFLERVITVDTTVI